MNGVVLQLYVPVPLTLFLVQTGPVRLRIWGQIQNHFFGSGNWFYSIGGKMAVDLEIRQGPWGYYGEMIGGGGSGQVLIGLRLGAAFHP